MFMQWSLKKTVKMIYVKYIYIAPLPIYIYAL